MPERCVLDGEIVIATDNGLDFEALQQRIHPAKSRVDLLAGQTPASFIAFDLLALGDEDYTGRPFAERRAALETALAERRPVGPPHADHDGRGRGAALVHRVRGRRARRRDRQAARHHLPAGQAGDVQDQAHPHRRLRARRVPLAQDLDRRQAAGRLAAARALQRRAASFSTSASSVRSPRSDGPSSSTSSSRCCLRDGDEHPWSQWAEAEAHRSSACQAT